MPSMLSMAKTAHEQIMKLPIKQHIDLIAN